MFTVFRQYQSFWFPCVRVAALPLVSKTVTSDNGTQSQLLQRSRCTPGGRNILLAHSLSTCIMSLLVYILHINVCMHACMHACMYAWMYVCMNDLIYCVNTTLDIYQNTYTCKDRESIIETQPIPSRGDPQEQRFLSGLSTAKDFGGSPLGGLGSTQEERGMSSMQTPFCYIFRLIPDLYYLILIHLNIYP